MASLLRFLPSSIAALSFVLNLAILICAARALSSWNSQHASNVYFLPVWNAYFEIREYGALIGTSVPILLLNLATSLAPLLRSPRTVAVPASASALLASLISLVFCAVVDARASAAGKDTLRSWTCSWQHVSNQGVPADFASTCEESRFAFFATIPSFVLQILVLGSTFAVARRQLRERKSAEKGDFSELVQVVHAGKK